MEIIVSGGHYTGKIKEQLATKESNKVKSAQTIQDLINLISTTASNVDVLLLLSTSFSSQNTPSKNEDKLIELIQSLTLNSNYLKTRLNFLQLGESDTDFESIIVEQLGKEAEFEKYLYYKMETKTIKPTILYKFIKGDKSIYEPDDPGPKMEVKENRGKNKLGLSFKKDSKESTKRPDRSELFKKKKGSS